MFDEISIPAGTPYEYVGSSPYDEDCVQVEPGEDYLPKMRRELSAYKHQLERIYPHFKGYIRTKWERHDFGKYGELVIYFKKTAPGEPTWEDVVENLPANWDNEALTEIASKNEQATF